MGREYYSISEDEVLEYLSAEWVITLDGEKYIWSLPPVDYRILERLKQEGTPILGLFITSLRLSSRAGPAGPYIARALRRLERSELIERV